MRALLNATGYNSALEPVVSHTPTPLLRVVDKPIIVHVIERLSQLHITHFDIIVSHMAHHVEAYLRDGKRWGVQIVYHLAGDPEKPFTTVIPTAQGWHHRMMLIGHVDILPKIHHKNLRHWNMGGTTLLFHRAHGWIGWGTLPVKEFQNVSRNLSYDELPHVLHGHHKARVSGVLMSVHTLKDWQVSNHKVLSVHAPPSLFPSSSHMVEPNVWLSRATTIHPTAKIAPPVYIGENCQIREYARVGPDAVVESHCVIGKNSTIKRSLVCQESYVGEGLEVHDDIIDKGILVNIALGTTVRIADEFILGDVVLPPFRQHFVDAFERIIAFLLLLMFWPLSAFSSTEEREPTVRLPAKEYAQYEFFFLQRSKLFFLTVLLNIARGNMHLVGLPPRSPQELDTLPKEWRSYVLRGRVGWITPHDIETVDDPYLTESYYIQHRSTRGDLGILFAWIKKILDVSVKGP